MGTGNTKVAEKLAKRMLYIYIKVVYVYKRVACSRSSDSLGADPLLKLFQDLPNIVFHSV